MSNRLGPTPMQIEVWSAVHAGDVEHVKKLVASGANVNQRRRVRSLILPTPFPLRLGSVTTEHHRSERVGGGR